MRVAGIMSGTSVDGIAVAVVDIHGRKVDTVAFRSKPYPKNVREAILAVSNTTTTTGAIARLHYELGALYAQAVRDTIPVSQLDLIGCHGQTIYHEGGRATLQIGEAGVIAERTGIPVISDFRAADIAAGGQGAPLVPFVDWLLFRHSRVDRIALNIGGIANFTAIPAGARSDNIVAFDTGPGNMVIDALATDCTGGRKTYDEDGRLARSGHVNQTLLESMLANPYYAQRPPKSAGREQYGREYARALLRSGIPLKDLIATATVLTAATIAIGVRDFSRISKGELIVSGGGAHNPLIMAQLSAFLPDFKIATSSDYGIDVDAKEAIAFAVLAHETWHRRPGNLPSATGAGHPAILGKVHYGNGAGSRL